MIDSSGPAVFGLTVFGLTIDDETRCVHYGTAKDVIAIKFACCQRYYPCHLCHEQTATHPAQQWPLEQRDEKALLCGVCKTELTIEAYLRVDACPTCAAEFNEGCRLHSHLYFKS